MQIGGLIGIGILIVFPVVLLALPDKARAEAKAAGQSSRGRVVVGVVGRSLTRFVELLVGVATASVLVVGLTLDAWPDVVLVAAVLLASLPLHVLASRLLAVGERALQDWCDLGRDVVVAFVSWAWFLVVLAVRGVIHLGLVWVVVRLLGAAGLSSRLDGLWPTVAATVVLYAAAGVVRRVGALAVAMVRRPSRAWLTWQVAELPLTALAIGVGVLILPGLRIGANLGVGGQVAAVVVLAMLITVVRADVTAPFLTLPTTLVVTGTKLWLASLLSMWMTTPLRIDGVFPLIVLTLLVTALTWPAARERRIVAARDQARQHAEMQQMHGMGPQF